MLCQHNHQESNQDLVHDSIDKISEPAALSAALFYQHWILFVFKDDPLPVVLVNSEYLSVSVWLFQTNGIDPIPSARSLPRSDLPSPLGAPPAISITDSIADLMQVLLWKAFKISQQSWLCWTNSLQIKILIWHPKYFWKVTLKATPGQQVSTK